MSLSLQNLLVRLRDDVWRKKFTLTVPRMLVAGVIAICAVALVACAGGSSSTPAAPVTNDINGGVARVITMPSGIPKVIAKCDGRNMIYVTTYSDPAIAVVADDPRCIAGK